MLLVVLAFGALVGRLGQVQLLGHDDFTAVSSVDTRTIVVPALRGRILDRLAHGAITPMPNIAALEGDTVRFTDGSEVHADLVVYCTGYKITFPFFDEDFIAATENELPLFKFMFHPEYENLFFLGLVQPLGAIMPIAERQSILITEALRGADRRYEEAAATLGANRVTVFTRVTLPMVLPGIGAGAVLCWARALGEFGATITFAGNFPGTTQTMPLAVYMAMQRDPEAAIVLSLVLLLVSLVVLATLRERWVNAS